MIDCMDEMVKQLRGVNSPESFHAALPELQSAIDRFKEIYKEAAQLEREEGRFVPDPETDKRITSRMEATGNAYQKELLRICRIPGINPGDIMAFQQMCFSLKEVKFRSNSPSSASAPA
jgi:hypothetical protein